LNTEKIKIEDSSFRDNLGTIVYLNNRILRVINKSGKKNLDFINKSGLLESAVKKEFLIETKLLNPKKLPFFFSKYEYVLESNIIPYISYPYEWTFEQLKIAAIHHLDFQIYLFNKGAVLRDSSAYNIQFIGAKPYFIDLLSIEKYQEGEYWLGYKQFCENFLNPLLLGSLKGIQHNNWFRGALEGIETTELNKIISLKDKLSLKIFTHVCLQADLNKKSVSNPEEISLKYKKLEKLPRKAYIAMLHQLKNWISKLFFKKDKTIWQNYSKENTYNFEENNEKVSVVKQFILKEKPNTLIDLGCNNGSYSKLSLNSGANSVIGFDFDHNAVSEAFNGAFENKLNFLPLLFDAANPSPSQGWNQKERKGFLERFKSDALIALAFEHHLIIGKNIPMEQFFDWIFKISKKGLIEFVPKSDYTIQKMLKFRNDIFLDYSEKKFEELLKKKAKIVNKTNITKSGRVIYEYKII